VEDPKTLHVVHGPQDNDFQLAWEVDDTLEVFFRGSFGAVSGVVVDQIRREKSVVAVFDTFKDVEKVLVYPVKRC